MQLRLGLSLQLQRAPTKGKCEGGWTWHVETGSYGDITLDGLNFSVYVNWPGAIHEGNGEALVLIDERADARSARRSKRSSAARSVDRGACWDGRGRRCTGRTPSRTISPSMASRRASSAVSTSRSNAARSGIPLRAPKSHPGVVLPQGIILKRGDLGATTRFRVSRGIEYDHSGQYMAVGPFDYASA